jgi:hypothetical protein
VGVAVYHEASYNFQLLVFALVSFVPPVRVSTFWAILSNRYHPIFVPDGLSPMRVSQPSIVCVPIPARGRAGRGAPADGLNIELLRAIATAYEWPKDPAYHWFWKE